MSTNVSAVTGLTAKKATAIPTIAQNHRGGEYSVNIVSAKGNRKSIKLTKKLAEALQLGTGVYVTIYADDGSLVLSSAPVDENSALYTFSNTTDYIVYNANLVHFIAETFALDYTSRTSRSFKNIKFGSFNSIAYAEVILAEKATVTTGITDTTQVAQGESDGDNI